MSKFVNVKESFVKLLERNAIEGRITTNPKNLPSNQIKTEMSFNDIHVDESTITFYDDPQLDRAECIGALYIDLNQIDRVIYREDLLGLDCLHGKYDAVLHFKDNSQVLISFNMRDINKIPPLWESAVKNIPSFGDRLIFKNEIIGVILSHKGSYVININGGDFISDSGFEAFNLIFTSIRQLVSKELLCFDNHETKPVDYTDENIPVYPMDISTNFYIEVSSIIYIEELIAEDYRDVFEYPTKRIFNLHMDNKSIITIGLLD